MSSKEKEEYEVGIPLDDLSSAGAEQPDSDVGAAEDQSRTGNSDGEDGIGLPSLFDEDELAEVGLKAAPFDDADESLAEADDETVQTESNRETAEADLPLEPIAVDNALVGGLEDPDIAGMAPDDAGPAEDLLLIDEPHGIELPALTDDAPDEDPDGDKILAEIGRLHTRLAELKEEFSGKLKYDLHKDKIIDKLHQELQEYKEDIVKKHILSIVLDVVKVADDIRKWLAYFRSLDVSHRDPVKLFRYLEAIPSDLEDIFYWQGVKPFTSRDDVFNPARQRTLKKIPTNDRAKDKTIAKSLRPGYEWEDKVIRQEMVAVYVYEDDSESSESADTRDIDE